VLLNFSNASNWEASIKMDFKNIIVTRMGGGQKWLRCVSNGISNVKPSGSVALS